jgi:hypothetical protein
MRKLFPDLALRARIAQQREIRAKLKQATAALEDVAGWLHGVVKQISERDEDEFVAHLKECPDCRRQVGRAARAGAKLSMRVLTAAGVEVLN